MYLEGWPNLLRIKLIWVIGDYLQGKERASEINYSEIQIEEENHHGMKNDCTDDRSQNTIIVVGMDGRYFYLLIFFKTIQAFLHHDRGAVLDVLLNLSNQYDEIEVSVVVSLFHCS